MNVVFIVSTKGDIRRLKMCVASIRAQTEHAGVIVASDTATLPPDRNLQVELSAKVVKQEDFGWRKERILNEAALSVLRIYRDNRLLVFTDGDCVFEPRWLEKVLPLAKPGRVLCGMYTDMCGEKNAEAAMARPSLGASSFEACRYAMVDAGLGDRYWKGDEPLWAGNGSCVFLDDFMAVNGFDERFGWCGADRNFGIRCIEGAGMEWRHISSTGAVHYHLSHPRPFLEVKDDWRKGDRATGNLLSVKWAAEAKDGWTEFGIIKGPRPGTDPLAGEKP